MSQPDEEKTVQQEPSLSDTLREPGFLRELWQQVRLVYYLLRDPEVPIYLKFLPFAAFIYLLSPIDFVPDALVGLGQLDDLTVLLVGAKAFIDLAPPAVVAKHLEKIRRQDGFAAFQPGKDAHQSEDLDDVIIIDSDHEVIVEKKPKE